MGLTLTFIAQQGCLWEHDDNNAVFFQREGSFLNRSMSLWYVSIYEGENLVTVVYIN